MIDSTTETLIPLREAARLVPRPNRKGVHVMTLHRWASQGVRGVRLEVVHMGALAYTSRRAVQKFLEASTAARAAAKSTSPAGA